MCMIVMYIDVVCSTEGSGRRFFTLGTPFSGAYIDHALSDISPHEVATVASQQVTVTKSCSVRAASRREFRTSRKARDSSSSPACLTIWVKVTVRLNLLYISTPTISDCFVMLLDIGMYNALPITGGSCAKSPQMITFTPPNGRWLYSGKASQQREWRMPSIRRDTIDFSSIMMYRMSLNSTCILLRWLSLMGSSGFCGEMWKSRWRVYPLMLCAATPVGAHRTTGSPRPLLAANWAKCDDTISIK